MKVLMASCTMRSKKTVLYSVFSPAKISSELVCSDGSSDFDNSDKNVIEQESDF